MPIVTENFIINKIIIDNVEVPGSSPGVPTMTKQEAVKEIRSKAGVPLTWCKEAYDKCGGDIQLSVEWIHKHYGNHWAM